MGLAWVDSVHIITLTHPSHPLHPPPRDMSRITLEPVTATTMPASKVTPTDSKWFRLLKQVCGGVLGGGGVHGCVQLWGWCFSLSICCIYMLTLIHHPPTPTGPTPRQYKTRGVLMASHCLYCPSWCQVRRLDATSGAGMGVVWGARGCVVPRLSALEKGRK